MNITADTELHERVAQPYNSSELADVVAVSVEFEDVDVAVVVVVVVVADAVLSVEAEAVAVVVLSALDVVEVVEVVVVVDEPDEDRDAHTSEKPFTSSYTFSTRPLVGTVRSQSGGSSAATAEISDWQSDEAHMSTYSASVGSDVEYSMLKPESSVQPWNELSVSTLASVV
ncbi:hypothetical protein BBJ28_00025320 [Nothophytophthora sp. Chile5]|nr:hypothetical protein BBJ28_00025320 [Nothophytophthora sp. Chile5]